MLDGGGGNGFAPDMRRRLLLLLFTCGCGASASPSTTLTIPTAAPVATAAATANAAPSPSALARDLDQLDKALVGAMGSRPAQPGDVPTGRLDGAPSGGLGGIGGGVTQPGAVGGAVPAGGSGGKVKGPIGKAAIGSAQVKGTIANAPAVIAGMAAGFRRCFSKGLMDDPSMKGSVTITASIGPQGEVVSASPSGGNGLSSNVIACVTARVSSAQFAPPDGGAATVSIPVTFSADVP